MVVIVLPNSGMRRRRRRAAEARPLDANRRRNMSKLIVASIMVVLWIAVAVAGEFNSARTINLNKPGALETLQQSNPTHYDKVRKILDGILQQPDADVPRWIQTSFDARNVSYAPFLLTTRPPKRRLSFALDETRYEAVLTVTKVRAEIVPLN